MSVTIDEEPTEVELDHLEASRFGDYLVVDRIATGGMGAIDLAVHAPAGGVERPVALKRLRADLTSDPRFVEMFVDEVRIATRISHPHVVPLLNAGIVEGQWFYAMDLMIGVPLAQVIAHLRTVASKGTRRRFPAVLTRLICDACEGLHAAHELRDENGQLLQVVHRDVGPENLFVGFDGGVRVIDFGIASARDRLGRTEAGHVRGKLAYVAPERIRREGRPVDRRVDVWALGVTLWEGLTLRPLFHREDVAAAVEAICEARVPPIADHRADVPLEIEEVVARALAVDPDRRFATAREMGRALAEVAEWINVLLPGAAQRQRRVAEILSNVQREAAEMEVEASGRTTFPDLRLSRLHAPPSRERPEPWPPRQLLLAAVVGLATMLLVVCLALLLVVVL